MKKILLLLILSFPFVLQAQNVYSYIEEPICWTINGVDSSLTRIYLVSDRTPDQRLLLYTINAEFDTVSVTTDSISFGWCDCCGGGSGGDISPWKDAAGNNTNDASIYVQRTGDVSIGVNDNSHTLRMDGDFQFQFPNNTGIFDWRESGSSDWDRTGLLLQDNGEINSFPFTGRNVFGLAANNGSIFDRTILGAILWAGTDPVGGDLSTTAGILAQADGNWATGDLATQLNFFITKDGESLPTNTFTLQSDGRLELDEYTNFNDGVPNSMVWYEDTDKDLFKTDISGTASSGDVIKVDGVGTGLEWGPQSVEIISLTSDLVEVNSDFNITALSTTLTSTSTTFTANDIGKSISIYGADSIGGEFVTTIASFTSANEIELTDQAQTTVVNSSGFYATNNSSTLSNAINSNKSLKIETGTYYFGDEIAKNNIDNFTLDFQGSTIYFNTFFNSSWGEGYNDNLEQNLFDLQNCDNVKLQNGTAEFLGQTFALNDTVSYSSEFTTTIVTPGQEITITSTSNVFTSNDVNKIIRLQSTGSQYYYFYISEFVSASEVSIKDGGGFDNPNLGTLQANLTNADGKLFTEDGYSGIIQGTGYDRRYNKRGNTGDFVKLNSCTNIELSFIKTVGLGQLVGISGSSNSKLNIFDCEIDGFGNVAISPVDFTTIQRTRINNESAQAITAIDQGQNIGTTHAIYTTQAQQNVIIDDNDLSYIRGVAIQWNTGSSGKSKGHLVTNNYMFETQRAGTIQGSADWEIKFSSNIWENCGQWSVNSGSSSIYINGDTHIGEPTQQTDYLGSWGVVNASYFELKHSTLNGVFTGSTGTDVSALSFSMQSASAVRDINVNIDNNIFINNTNDLQFINEQFALTAGNEIKITRNEFLGNVYLVKSSSGTYRQADLEEYILFENNNFYGTTFIRMGASFLYNNFTKIGNSDLALDIDMLSDAGASGERNLVLNHNNFDRINGTDSDIITLSAASDLRVVFDYNNGLDQSAQVELNSGSFISRKGLYRDNNDNYKITTSGNTAWTLETTTNSYTAVNFLKNDGNYWKINTQSNTLSGALLFAASGNSSPLSGVRMSLTTSGNLGIGLGNTDTASEKLEVEGNIKLRSEGGTVRADLVGNDDNRGSITITEAQTGSYTFNVAKSDTTYIIATSIRILSGSSTITSAELTHTVEKTTTGITVSLQGALDSGESVAIDWILVQ